MSALVALVDAVVADVLANVTLPTQGSSPWKYAEPRVENPEDLPLLAVHTDGAVYAPTATVNEYERRWDVTIDFYTFNFAGAEYGGAGDVETIIALEPVAEALAGRVSQYALSAGIPGYTNAVGGTPSATGVLRLHTVEPVEGAVYRARVVCEITEWIDFT